MERIHASFPFGIISGGVLERCRPLFSLTTAVTGGYSGRPDDRHIYAALRDASAAYCIPSLTAWIPPPGSNITNSEALILHLVRHPNIRRFTSIAGEQFKIYIITPWHTHGHIMKYIAVVEGVHLKELLLYLAHGLHFLSQYGIVHGDLKGSNILISDDRRFRIIIHPRDDRGRTVACEAISTGRLSITPRSISILAATVLSAASCSGGGTFRWMAPERLVPSAFELPTVKATIQSDVYSFGMLMLEVFSGEPISSSSENLGPSSLF
ncbi:kinase-like domain-containing protein [Mycena leptocephala]|nr:kinase-like domain-containing protein [Mycena leptocephala]